MFEELVLLRKVTRHAHLESIGILGLTRLRGNSSSAWATDQCNHTPSLSCPESHTLNRQDVPRQLPKTTRSFLDALFDMLETAGNSDQLQRSTLLQ